MPSSTGGFVHWTMSHPKIKIAVSSYYVVEPRVLIDPLIPDEGLDWFRRHGEPWIGGGREALRRFAAGEA